MRDPPGRGRKGHPCPPSRGTRLENLKPLRHEALRLWQAVEDGEMTEAEYARRGAELERKSSEPLTPRARTVLDSRKAVAIAGCAGPAPRQGPLRGPFSLRAATGPRRSGTTG